MRTRLVSRLGASVQCIVAASVSLSAGDQMLKYGSTGDQRHRRRPEDRLLLGCGQAGDLGDRQHEEKRHETDADWCFRRAVGNNDSLQVHEAVLQIEVRLRFGTGPSIHHGILHFHHRDGRREGRFSSPPLSSRSGALATLQAHAPQALRAAAGKGQDDLGERTESPGRRVHPAGFSAGGRPHAEEK